MPGGRYKQWAGHIRALGREVMDDPVNYVKQNMVGPCALRVNDRAYLVAIVHQLSQELTSKYPTCERYWPE